MHEPDQNPRYQPLFKELDLLYSKIKNLDDLISEIRIALETVLKINPSSHINEY